MIHSTEFSVLVAAIAHSPIVVASPAPPARDFADWCERQRPADLDSVILAWLHAQAPARRTYS